MLGLRSLVWNSRKYSFWGFQLRRTFPLSRLLRMQKKIRSSMRKIPMSNRKVAKIDEN